MPSCRSGPLLEVYQAARLLGGQRGTSAYLESTETEVRRKIERWQALASRRRIDRVHAYRELARLEEKRGNDLIACTYRFRAMRLAGQDHHHDLGRLGQTLRAKGFPAEADAVEAMFGRPDAAPERCRQLLQEAYERHRQAPPPVAFEAVDDRRGAEPVRASVIVSLYRAASKLPAFLQALQSQTLLRAKQAEVLFIDSGSPDDEYRALTQTNLSLPFPYLYVRTRQRETIQTAWNRGIALAGAAVPELSRGRRDGDAPGGKEVLADCLDADPTLDWVQADCLETEVDADGVLVRVERAYDRSGPAPAHPYLDTTFLSWVGALYRRSIHDRFGYYDGSSLRPPRAIRNSGTGFCRTSRAGASPRCSESS